MLPMLPMLALAGLAGFAGYQYSKAKQKSNTQTTTAKTTTNEEKTPSEKQNIYNYYTNDSIDGNTLFNGQTSKKRTLFGNN